MPDLLTHFFVGAAGGMALGRRVEPVAFLAGSVLPDLASRGLGTALPSLRFLGVVAHFPLGVALQVGMAACLFPPELRRRGSLGVGLGALLHCILDACQTNLFGENAVSLYPLTWEPVRLGFWGSNDWPVLLALAALPGLWGLWRLVRHVLRGAP
ncbi:MAG: metal-dependent hydrolase [Planctomycetota bacterium]